MWFAMLDLVKAQLDDRHTPVGLALEVEEEGREETWFELVELFKLFAGDDDRCDLVKHALGFTDEEIGRNAKVRRHRTRMSLKTLADAT